MVPKRTSAVRASLSAILTLGCLAATGCKGKENKDAPLNAISLPGKASRNDIGTKLGNGAVVDTGQTNVPTSVQWTRIYADKDKSRLVLGGSVQGEAYALITTDKGKTWKAFTSKVDGNVAWSVGTDGYVVAAVSKRAIPEKPLPPGTQSPIDTLTFFFGAPDQPKLSTPAQALVPDPAGKEQKATIPRGNGMPALLPGGIASVIVETRPRSFVIAYVSAAETAPATIPLPSNEVPVHAPFGHPPQLLTTNGKQLLVRPWPQPNEKLAEPKAIDKITLTRTLESDLSEGPECEWGGWSFRRLGQEKVGTVVLGVSPEKTAVFALPPSVANGFPIGCSPEKVAFEYIDDEDKLPRVASCTVDGACTKPRNRPFLKPWPEQTQRKLFLAPTPVGIAAIQQVRSRVKWTVDLSNSKDGGVTFVVPAPFGEGEGNPEDGYDVGALGWLGERMLLLLSAKVDKSTKRSWYVLASDDNGDTWGMP